MSTSYSGDFIQFASFFASNYSTSTYIFSDSTVGYISGLCNVYVTEYPRTMTESTSNLAHISHTLAIEGV